MMSSNTLFMPTVKSARLKMKDLVEKNKIKQLYFSRHFFERAVERNIDNKIGEMFVMSLHALVDMRKHTYNIYKYKVSKKGIFMIAQVEIGKVTGQRQIIIKTCYDSDIFNEKKYDVELKLN